MIKAVFFDLDDTLCNYMSVADASRLWVFGLAAQKHEDLTVEALEDAWQKEFHSFLPEVREGGAWRKKYLREGEPTRTEVMRRALKRVGIDDEPLAAGLSEGYYVERTERLELFADAPTVLDRLGATYPLGLITNGPADTQREEIAKLGIAHRFRTILIEGEFGVGKPDKTIFHAAAESIDAQPCEVIFVGNSWFHDIVGAHEAGLITCFLDMEGHVGGPEADYHATSLLEVADWVEERATEGERSP